MSLLPSQTHTEEIYDAIKLSAEHFFEDDERIDWITVFFDHASWYIRVILKDEFYAYADDPERTFAVVDQEQSEWDIENDIPGFGFEEL